MNLKRILPIFLSLALLFSLLPTNTAFAEAADELYVQIDTGAWITLSDTDCDGYYEIGMEEELYAFAFAVNQYPNKGHINGKLTKDITVNESVPSSYEDATLNSEAYRNWTPIGKYNEHDDSIPPYTGTFDGNGKTISGLFCINSDGSRVGLFGCIARAGGAESTEFGTVKNLTIKDSYFCSAVQSASIGAVVGYNNGGTVSGCKNENSTIDCKSDSDSAYAGGVVGYSSTDFGSAKIENCSNSGTVSASSSSAYAGGVVGYGYTDSGSVTVQSCSNSGTVSATSSASYSSAYAGGVVGYSSTGSGFVTLQNCYNIGAVSATSNASYASSAYAAGVVGYSYTGSGFVTVQNCYNIGAVSATSNAPYGSSAYAGGVVGYGYTNSGSVTVQNCYNIGKVSAGGTSSSSYSSAYAGGVIGYSDGSAHSYSVTIANCYYLGDEEEANAPSGTEHCNEEMFRCGAVAYFLNHGTEDSDEGTDESSSENIWKQTIGVDEYPNFTGLEVLSDGETSCWNDLSQFKIHSVGDDKKSAVVVLSDQGDYQLVFAHYEEGKLAEVKISKVEADEAKAALVTLEEAFPLDTGDKVMLWNNFNDLIPLCEVYEMK